MFGSIGGFDESLGAGGDDFDLHKKCLERGYKIERTKNIVMHNEGNLTLKKLIKKHFMYGKDVMNYIKKSMMVVITLSTMLCAMETETRTKHVYKLVVSEETIAGYKSTMPTFLETKRKQRDALTSSFTGFFASIYGAFNGINMDEAKAFLTRAFENEEKLQQAIDRVEERPDNVAYLQTVLSQVKSHDVAHQKADELPKIMKEHRHLKVPKNVKPWNKAHLADDEFYNFAACNFMAFHMVESEGDARIREAVEPHHRHHRHHQHEESDK